jgi:citrate lyase subunit beta/citryl-CoA lyase
MTTSPITPLHFRLRRSALYLPGANARAMAKARELPADALIFDLEDSVLPDAKDAARESVARELSSGGYGQRELVVRVNSLATPWHEDDLRAAAQSGAHAVLLPKVDDALGIERSIGLLERAGAPNGMRVWALIETPAAVLHLEEIASASPRLAVLCMGFEDLGKAMRVDPSPPRTALLPILSLAVAAARSQGLDILDGVFTDLSDSAGYADSCRQGKAFGLDGKTLIHPSQIQTANEVFGVSPAEVEAAAEIIHAWEAATAQGKGVVVVRGRLVEHLHVAEARRVLELAAASARTTTPAQHGA